MYLTLPLFVLFVGYTRYLNYDLLSQFTGYDQGLESGFGWGTKLGLDLGLGVEPQVGLDCYKFN